MNSHSKTHKRISRFVDWIAPDKDKEDSIREQSENIRNNIASKAIEDGLTIQSTPNSGSFAKRTGLRRHMQGASEVEGQDVDLPFVVSPKTKDQEILSSLLDRFQTYAESSYPNNISSLTKSSVVLAFKNTKLNYDLVPMLATENTDRQILLRADGERRETSVQKHIKFIQKRTQSSNLMEGRVKFNECVRLFKWWRILLQSNDSVRKIPSIVIDLLCAMAYDNCSVQYTYPETLARWFGYLHNHVGKRKVIYFKDYQTWSSPPVGDDLWYVVDPVSSENNITKNWKNWEIDGLAEQLLIAHDQIIRAITCCNTGDDVGSLQALVQVFGSSLKSHCGDDE